MLDIELLKIIEKISTIVLSFVSVIGIITGVYMAHNYMAEIRKRKYESLFGFCPKLSSYLLEFKYIFDTSPDRNILLYCYNTDSLKPIDGIMIPDFEEVESFREQIKNYFDFIRNTDNQMPLSLSFIETFNNLEKKLSLLVHLGKLFPYGRYDSETGRKRIEKESMEIIGLIDTLLKNIHKEQKATIEKLGNS